MINTLKKISIHISIAFLILLPLFVFAQTPPVTTEPPVTVNQPIGINIPNPLKNSDGSLMSLIVQILNNIVMPIGAVLCVIWIIYAGFKYVTAQGNPKAIGDAHQTLLWALVGTGILLGAAGISQVIQATIKSIVNY
jgi:hypothetical protein